ncbi:MAG: SDR family NAD(P)-dependent oxidoreductase, partial [Duganella sp.]
MNGSRVAWPAQHAAGGRRAQRLHLPVYPFEQGRYWRPNTAPAGAGSEPAMLHPLLHRNTSTLSAGHRYSSRFTGREFFFAQHVIMGRKVLPGVAHLEMVRAAVREACGGDVDTRCLQIKNVVWMRPVACHDGDGADRRTVIHIALERDADGDMAFTIFSGGEGASSADQPVAIHSQGVALLHAVDAIPTVDLVALRAQCGKSTIAAHHHFDAMRLRGADLGPGFSGITDYHLGATPDGVPLALAHIVIPDGLSDTLDRFVLHPTAMDAAVHTAPPLMPGWEDAARIPLALPFALAELEVLGSCQEEMWALARPAPGAAPGSLKYDIDLCDDAGMVCVRFKGFSFRVVEQAPVPESQQAAPVDTLLLQPRWQPGHRAPRAALAARRLVVVCGLGPASRWQGRFAGADVRVIDAASGDHADLAAQALALVQSLLQSRLGDPAAGRALVQFVAADPMLALLGGLARVLRRENPKVDAQVVLVAADDGAIVARVDASAAHPGDTLVRYRASLCETEHWTPVAHIDSPAAAVPWREGGVYLITGGAGALGAVFAREILARLQHVTVVLSGRSGHAEVPDHVLKELRDDLRHDVFNDGRDRAADPRIVYLQADMAQAASVDALIGTIRARHGRLDGVLHCAGVVRDNFILFKTPAELREVFAPKVAGLLNLERALAGMDLDFVALFSSIAAAIGNAGQADYAMANAFLDAHADQQHGARRTVSINWPLWRDGGMTLDEQSERWMADNTGLAPMRTATGIDAFYRALSSGLARAMVLEGHAATIEQFIPGLVAPATAAAPPSIAEQFTMQSSLPVQPPSADAAHRFNEVVTLLQPLVGGILKLAPGQLDLDKELIGYGFDSISLTELTNKLNTRFKIGSRRALNPTVFFEHPTLRSFAAQLAAEYPEVAGEAAASAPAPTAQPVQTAHTVPTVSVAPAPVDPHPPAMHRGREPVAVVGISGRFPMARDVREYWRNLAAGRDCIGEVPADRWNWRDYFGDPKQEGDRTDVRFGGFIEGVDEFDPLFFGISPREALYMDPMQRLLMQHTWQAIEDAGYSTRALAGTRTAIFVGTSVSEYGMLLQKAGVPCDAFMPTGRSASLGANRMSYLLNISGPSETIDTACSSSLVAIHRAVMAIDSGQADMALVGGVNVLIAPDGHISFRKAGMLSEDGRCKTFSSAADGYARGEGAGMLFLKKLSDAERDGDHIYGLVRGSGENHGGRANSLTAPNPKAQADLIKTVVAQAGVDPRTIGFVEAHGTGTPLGDPVEVNALKMAFRDLYQASGDTTVTSAHCGLGSAKSNIGHLELAAGVAGAIKVLLQLRHRTLVKSLHSENLNPYIDLQGTPFHVVRETAPWPAPVDAAGQVAPRRAGVSSFGFGGANAHVLFEEYVPPPGMHQHRHEQRERLIVLSARSEERLVDAARALLAAIADDAPDIDSIAYTLQAGRDAFDERLGFSASSMPELRERLQGFVAGTPQDALYRGRVARGDQVLSLFDGDELRETAARWVARKQLGKLLAVWVKGVDVDWRLLYPVAPRRVSLPGYPFARERHWPPAQAQTQQPPQNQAPAPAAPAASRAIRYLKKSWTPAALPPPLAMGLGRALILATDGAMALARALALQVDGDIVNLDDAATADAALARSAIPYAGVIDLSACGARAPGPVATLPWLQRFAAQRDLPQPAMLLGVTMGLEAFDNDSMDLAGAAGAGLYRMLQSEYAALRSRHVDLDRRDGAALR